MPVAGLEREAGFEAAEKDSWYFRSKVRMSQRTKNINLNKLDKDAG